MPFLDGNLIPIGDWNIKIGYFKGIILVEEKLCHRFPKGYFIEGKCVRIRPLNVENQGAEKYIWDSYRISIISPWTKY